MLTRRFEQSSPRIPDPAALVVAPRTEADLWTALMAVGCAIAAGLTSSTAVTTAAALIPARRPLWGWPQW